MLAGKLRHGKTYPQARAEIHIIRATPSSSSVEHEEETKPFLKGAHKTRNLPPLLNKAVGLPSLQNLQCRFLGHFRENPIFTQQLSVQIEGTLGNMRITCVDRKANEK